MPLVSVLVPLGAALAFPFAAMALKRAQQSATNTWAVVLACDLTVAALFLPFLFLSGPAIPWGNLWQPALGGALFLLGQAAAFKSFQGDLTIAIPVQGAKVLMVALLAMAALGEDVRLRVWVACGLSAIAIWLLHEPGERSAGRGSTWRTVGLAACAALAFACLDIAVQKWSPAWGPGMGGPARFGAWMFLAQGVFSLLLLFLPAARPSRIPKRAQRWLAGGAAGMAIITLGLVLVIGSCGNATQANLLFNSRCVFGVLAVWLLGGWFRNREADSGTRTLAHRLGGAGVMLAAIALALL